MQSSPEHPYVDHFPGRLRLRGKNCLIRAAGISEIGTIARLFALEGCRIWAIDGDESALKVLMNTITEEGGEANPRVIASEGLTLEEISRMGFARNFFDILIEEVPQATGASVTTDATLLSSLTLSVLTRTSQPSEPGSLALSSGTAVGDAYHRNTIRFTVGSRIPSREHWALTRQVAYTPLFLASEEASLVSNVSLHISID